MRSSIFISLLTISLSIHAADIPVCRNFFIKSPASKNTAKLFLLYTNDLGSGASPVEKGYQAAAKFIWCAFETNPIKKLRGFQEGRQLLENAIFNDPLNAELRYVRMAIQLNLPGMLGYSADIEKDRVLIEKYLYRAAEDSKDRDLCFSMKQALNLYQLKKQN